MWSRDGCGVFIQIVPWGFASLLFEWLLCGHVLCGGGSYGGVVFC